MAITATDLIWKKSQTVSDAGTNGGRIGSAVISSGVKNNIFPDVPEAERVAGSTKYRKVFIHLQNTSDLTLINPKVFLEAITQGEDAVTLLPGTFIDTQADIDGTYQEYACVALNADAPQGTQVLTVNLDLANSTPFAIGEELAISSVYALGVSGFTEYHTIQDVTYDVGGLTASITLVDTLVNDFLAASTTASRLISLADLNATLSNFVKTSTAGTIDSSAAGLTAYQLGALQETITLTFTSATAFSVVGELSGALGSGTINGDYTAVDGNVNDIFTIPTAFWGGTWAIGDTVTFETNPSAIPLWFKRVVPAGAATVAGNSVVLSVLGESS